MKTIHIAVVVFAVGCSYPASQAPDASLKEEKMEFFNGTGVLWICVSDIAESKAWYEKVLGVQFFMQPRPNQWIGAGPIKDIGFGLTEVALPVISEISPLTIGVVDAEKYVSHLKTLGEELAEEWLVIPGVVKVAVIQDPDGHKITFSQLLGSKKMPTTAAIGSSTRE